MGVRSPPHYLDLDGVEAVCGTRATDSPPSPSPRDTARAMSQENVEAVRQAAKIWNRGDLSAYFECLDDEVVVRAAEGWPETA
jgi:hypothetical protein